MNLVEGHYNLSKEANFLAHGITPCKKQLPFSSLAKNSKEKHPPKKAFKFNI